MLCAEAAHTNSIVFGLIRRDSNPQPTALEASTLTITPSMRFGYNLGPTNKQIETK